MNDFVTKMHRLDKTLYIKLDRKRERFVIYRNDRQRVPREILVIDNNGEFARPGYDHLVKLYKMDSWQNKSLIADIDYHNDQLDRDGDEHIHFLSNEMSKLATRSKYY